MGDGDASAAVSKEVRDEEVDADDGSLSTTCDAGGVGNGNGENNFGLFVIVGGFEGPERWNEGGGGKTKSDSGGVEVCSRDGGREDGASDVGTAGIETLEGPATGVADGVIGRDGTSGGGNVGIDV